VVIVHDQHLHAPGALLAITQSVSPVQS